MSDGTNRREFLQIAGGLAIATTLGGSAEGSAGSEPLPIHAMPNGQIARKPLGSTGQMVSIIGVGGYTLADAASYEEAAQIVHQSIELGVNFFDNAWEYHGGRSEEWMGKALKGKRDNVFLMSKVCTHGRDKDVAMKQLDESLKRLQTDHLDLWQVHECVYYNDPELHFRSGGVIEAVVEAKRQGKVKFIGFTGHKHPDIHLEMLKRADEHGLKFDTVQMPLNAFDATFRSFEKNVLPEARRRGMGALGMKSLGGGGQPLQQGAITVEEALRYAMSLPVATTISGIDSLPVMKQNLEIARTFKPMTQAEAERLRQRCRALAGDGHLELYKSTKKYDGDVGRQEHGYPTQKLLPL